MALSPPVPEQGLDFVPILRGELVVRRLGTEAVAWSDLRSHPVYLDPVSTVMLDVIDGVATTGELIDDVHSELGIERAAARAQILRVMHLFDSGGLLETSEPLAWSWSQVAPLLPEPDW